MALRMQSCLVNQHSNAQGQQENLLQNEMLTETDSIDPMVDTQQTKELWHTQTLLVKFSKLSSMCHNRSVNIHNKVVIL